MRPLLQPLALVGAGSLLGLALNLGSPRPVALGQAVYAAAESGAATCSAPHEAGAPSGYRSIRVDEAVGLCTGCTAGFVDARPASEYARGHVPNAFHLPPHELAGEAAVLEQLRGYATVVVYDSGEACNLADSVADHLRSEGLRDVRILAGAWPAWEQGGGPAESGACQSCGTEAHP